MAHLDAVAILVPDYDEAIAFYVGKAGFHLIEDTPQSATKRWVVIAPEPDSESRLLLARAANERQRAAIGNQTGGRVGFFLRVAGIEARFDEMRNAGVTFEEELRHEPYGKVAVWRDPWGNRWDLLGT